MTKFYAIATTKKEESSVSVPLTESLYHRAEQEAEAICKENGWKFNYIRVFQNHQKQPGILSKGNIQREHHKPKSRKKK